MPAGRLPNSVVPVSSTVLPQSVRLAGGPGVLQESHGESINPAPAKGRRAERAIWSHALIVLFLIATTFSASPARAQLTRAVVCNILGPTQFAASGGIHTTISFALPALVDPPYTLTLDKQGYVAGTIWLNGVAIPAVTGRTIRSVYLKNNNTITLKFFEGTGSSLTVSVAGYAYQFASDYETLPPSPATSVASLPDSVDWRSQGAVTPVKNEGDCRDDWAFSSSGLAEDENFLYTGKLVSLSEQQLLDCMPTASCDEGSPSLAIQYVITNDGIDTAASYPYTALEGSMCKFNPTSIGATLAEITRIPPGNEQALQVAVAQQPISIVLNGNWYASYTSGVAAPNCAGPFAPDYRAALIVGYGTDGGTPYWIVKNSLGTAWGESGYFRILRGQNACGISNYAIQASS